MNTTVERRKVGTLTFTKPQTFRISYETASWYTDVEVPAGTYELTGQIVLDTRYYGQPDEEKRKTVKTFGVKLPGIVTDEYFVNRLFHASSVAEKRDIGKPREYPWSNEGYVFAHHILDPRYWNEDVVINLDPDIRPEWVYYRYADTKGKEVSGRTAELFVIEDPSVVEDQKFLQAADPESYLRFLRDADESDTWQDLDSFIQDRASEIRDEDAHYDEIYGERQDIRHTLPRPWWWDR